MRQKDRQITEPEVIAGIIRDSQVCRLAMVQAGEPYLLPVCFGYDGDAIYIHTGRVGRKIDILAAGPRVCFEFERNVRPVRPTTGKACDWGMEYESVIGYGTVTELTGDADRLAGLERIMLQYSGREWGLDAEVLSRTRVWRIAIETLAARRSSPPG
jgi:uncharacterized protein